MASREQFTDADLIDLLKEMIPRIGSLRTWAKAHDLSASFVSDVMNGRRRISARLAAALGYKRVEAWEKT